VQAHLLHKIKWDLEPRYY